MKNVNLKPLVKALRGLLDGSLKLVAVPTGRKKESAPEAKAATKKTKAAPAKRGRKPLPASMKKAKELTKKRQQLKAAKQALPTPREIFVFLSDKLEGTKLTQIASHFKLKRPELKPLIVKLVASKDLTQMGGKFFLQRRLRGVGGKKTAEKAPAVTEKEVLAYLGGNPGSTMSVMAKVLSNGKYQKLIKVLNKLVKDGKVIKEGKGYRVGVQ